MCLSFGNISCLCLHNRALQYSLQFQIFFWSNLFCSHHLSLLQTLSPANPAVLYYVNLQQLGSKKAVCLSGQRSGVTEALSSSNCWRYLLHTRGIIPGIVSWSRLIRSVLLIQICSQSLGLPVQGSVDNIAGGGGSSRLSGCSLWYLENWRFCPVCVLNFWMGTKWIFHLNSFWPLILFSLTDRH